MRTIVARLYDKLKKNIFCYERARAPIASNISVVKIKCFFNGIIKCKMKFFPYLLLSVCVALYR